MAKGMPSLNPKGGPRGMSVFQIRMREDHDPAEMSAIAKALYRGEPFVRVIDPATGLPRLASAPIRITASQPGYERPKPLSMLLPGERIAEIVWPSPSEQLAAMKFVAEYAGWKPAAEVNMNVGHSVVDADFDDMTEAQLEAYLAARQHAESILESAKNANPSEQPFSSGSRILDIKSTENE